MNIRIGCFGLIFLLACWMFLPWVIAFIIHLFFIIIGGATERD
ncbi:hypothetical protein [Paenibacillus xylanexedens]|nr:hypothetical protein [Paenibacillus xylanexedens]RPK20102.1 hypothetical protein EDO6_06641 [Paenibacillus xylanexedens]